MKKNIIFAALAAASAILVSASCTKQEQPESIREAKTFTAVIEQDATKTVLTSANKVEWESGDLIKINDAEYTATPNSTDATKATFVLSTGMEPTAPYSAIYPTDLYVTTGSYSLPGTQYYSADKFNAPMYAESSTENFSFKNICGVLCFSLKGTDKVKSIKITANEPVCGAFTMTDPTTVNFTGTDKSVVLSTTSPVQLNSATPTDFYIYLPPGTYSAGMTVIITNIAGNTFEMTTTKSAVVERSNVYVFNWTPVFVPAGALSGRFSVSATKQVLFSPGNLQATYDGSKYVWGFAPNQYDYIGNVAGNTTINTQTSGAVVDLFGWSTSSTYYGISTSIENTDYVGSFVDWGTNIGPGWRTLTNAEWHYLLNYDSSAFAGTGAVDGRNTTREGLYAYGVTVAGKTNCLVLYPDGFTGTKVSNGDTTSYDTAAEWAAAQAAGVVCLPTSGYRKGSEADKFGLYTSYWSSSPYGSKAYYMYLSGSGIIVGYNENRFFGNPVRLVINVE